MLKCVFIMLDFYVSDFKLVLCIVQGL